MSDIPPDTSASLLVKLQDRENAAAWQVFTELYSPVIRRTAARMGLQTADVENVLQEVLLTVSRSIQPWLDRSDRGSFRSWLRRIAKNKGPTFGTVCLQKQIYYTAVIYHWL